MSPGEFAGMSLPELEAALAQARADLADLEETYTFKMTHTNDHIPGAQMLDHVEDIHEARRRVAAIESLVARFVKR